MQDNPSPSAIRQARVPHELFLTNLIGNHILWFISALGMAGSYWQPLLVVPLVSLSILAYILWRARRELRNLESGHFAACHWQLAARRSHWLLLVVALGILVALAAWSGYRWLGLEQVVVIALAGGLGLLPTMLTVLALIILESDALHQAGQGRMPVWLARRFQDLQATTAASKGTPQAQQAESHDNQAGDPAHPETIEQSGAGTRQGTQQE